MTTGRRGVWGCALAILAAGFLAYHGSFAVPFFFDDIPAIVENESIRDWSNLGAVLNPPGRGGVDSRPLVNLSFALNYAADGLNPRGYHFVNLIIHLLGALALFGLIRRMLLLPMILDRLRASSTSIALCVALLWTVHPLQTETVICSVQRNESMVSLFYLLTLYCFLRAAELGGKRGWYLVAVIACVAGMASKEVMVTAPVAVLLLDGTFIAGSFREAWQHRWRWHVGLGLTWLLLAWLVLGSGGARGGTAGLDRGISWWTYLLTQAHAITVYLKLTLWPHPLIVDYGVWLAAGIRDVWPELLLVSTLVVASVMSLWRWPRAGFSAVSVFLILGPSSSVYPLVSQTIAEHRMHLALAGLLALLVLAGWWANPRIARAVCLVLAAGATWLTIQRTADYTTEEALWSDLVAKNPTNAWSHVHLADTHAAAGRLVEAEAGYRRAVERLPRHAPLHLFLGLAVARQQRPSEALVHFEEAARLRPDYAQAHFNSGRALLVLGKSEEAVAKFDAAVKAFPSYVDAELMWGLALMQSGRVADSVAHFERALQLGPASFEATFNLGVALAAMGDMEKALPRFETATSLRPNDAKSRTTYARALLQVGRTAEARAQAMEALRLDPSMQPAREMLQRLPAEFQR